MNQFDSYLHTHIPNSSGVSTVQLNGSYEGLHLINVHSVSLFNTFINISANRINNAPNNVFYYTNADSIVIPDGVYTLLSFNKYLQSMSPTALTRVVASLSGTHWDVVSYASIADKFNDVNRTVQNVSTSSVLNAEIYSGIVWCDRVKLYCDVIKNGVNQNGNALFNTASESQFIFIPLTIEPLSH